MRDSTSALPWGVRHSSAHYLGLLAKNGKFRAVSVKRHGDTIWHIWNEDKINLGGEESAGMSIKGHYPKKDGIPACLLAAEAVAARGASLSEQPAALDERVGQLESGS